MCRLSWAPRRSDCRTLERASPCRVPRPVSSSSTAPLLNKEVISFRRRCAFSESRDNRIGIGTGERGGRASSSTRYPSLTTARTNESVVTLCHSSAKPKSRAPTLGSLGSRATSKLRPRLEAPRHPPVATSTPNG